MSAEHNDKESEIEIRQRYFGSVLKALREKAGLSQTAVAKQLDYSTPQFVSNWERGLSMPPLDVMPLLSSIYKISATEMINIVERYQLQLLSHQKKKLKKIFSNNKI